MRALVALAAVAQLAGSTPAMAGRTVCRLVTDRTGDVQPVSDDSLDIVSADVVADRRALTAVLRLRGWVDPDPNAPTGRAWLVLFRLAGDGKATTYYLEALGTPTGFRYRYGFYDSDGYHSLAAATGRVDVAHAEVHVTMAPLRLDRIYKLTHLEARTSQWAGVYLEADDQVVYQGLMSPRGPADQATGLHDYVIGTKSCVRVGG